MWVGLLNPKPLVHHLCSANLPFDLVGRLRNKETLSVWFDLNVGARVDGNTTLSAIFTSCLDGNQQQLKLQETHPSQRHKQRGA